MVVIEYWENVTRFGMLLWWNDRSGNLLAQGGYEPPEKPIEGQRITAIYSSDFSSEGLFDQCRQIEGWVHPDDIREISGMDSSEIVQLRYTNNGEYERF